MYPHLLHSGGLFYGDFPAPPKAHSELKSGNQHSGGVFYGDFPAPPKAHSELKSGNQSHTFK